MSEVENAVITTAELAKRLGIQPGTLRNIKSKYRDRFIEGEHFVGTESGNLWTIAGEALIRELTGVTGASDSPVTGDDRADDTPITPPQFDHAPARTIARHYAEGIAYQQIARYLPEEVAAVYDRLLNRPTPDDRSRLFALASPVNGLQLQQVMNGDTRLLAESIALFGGDSNEK